MNNSSLLTLLVLAAAVSAVAAGGIPPRIRETVPSGGSTRNASELIPIGNEGERVIDGKLYYANETEVTWFEAREMCRENGMHLGTITTSEQLEFLKSSWSVDFSGDHWMDGRDSQKASQFVWNSLGMEVTDQIIEFGGVEIPYQLCLTFWSLTMLSRTHAEFCTDKYPVLCEVEA